VPTIVIQNVAPNAFVVLPQHEDLAPARLHVNKRAITASEICELRTVEIENESGAIER
jgi:hypothetical protein